MYPRCLNSSSMSLPQENYDPAFVEHIYSVPQVSLAEVQGRKRQDLGEARVTYKTKNEFKDIAKKLGVMDDFKVRVVPFKCVQYWSLLN